ncbi:MAG TPA: histidine kinase [Vicinamibacterales bacterium]|nr:histidine kinase [Vicinamibacterales bacterium]
MVAEQRNRRFWLETAIIFAAWAVFGLLVANQSTMLSSLGGRDMPWIVALRPALLDAVLWALTTLAIFWLARRFPIERGRVLQGIAVHLVAAVVIALARTGVMVVLGWYLPWVRVQRVFSMQFWGTSSQNFLFYALLLGIGHMVLYYRRYREREQAAEQLARGLTEARLQALKMQLQPHFLFNTLNAISALIPAEAKPARRMVARLGDLLRVTLEHEETQEVTLREELAFLQPYLEIEQARLEDRLTVVMNIAPETLDARVPHLILQPLVENAIRHGIAERIEPGKVEISASRGPDDRFLQLEIRDDGRGVDRNNDVRARRGVGLTNIRSRLEQLYGGEHRFKLENQAAGGVLVQITLPFRRAEKGEKSAP